jgi:hypothetical protein
VRPGERRDAGGERRLIASRRDFAVTLLDGRRVVGRRHGDGGGQWSVYVYLPAPDAPLLGYGTASTLTCAAAPDNFPNGGRCAETTSVVAAARPRAAVGHVRV